MSAQETYQNLLNWQKETVVLSSIAGVLGWDQRVVMPPKGAPYRAEQLAMLSGIIHQRATDPRIGEWLSELEQSELMQPPDSITAVNIRQWRREYDRLTKLPTELVMEFTRVTSLAEKVWEEAREKSDFRLFQPHLEQIVRLVREIAERLGYEREPYDALLDEYEQGMTAQEVEQLFEPIRRHTPELVERLMSAPRQPDTSILHRHYPRAAQEAFCRYVAETIGFDWQRGRLDPTVHPFATRLSPGDVRITTRYYEDFLNPSLFGTIHELGHALYEMGLPEEHWGTPMGSSVSLGVHESQSRLWENFVGRSRAFWEFFYPVAQQHFSALADVSLDDFVFAINAVRPSTIRVEADEVTYNLHILLRFELELALVRGDLPVADLPSVWNERFKAYMGFEPPNDAQGVLQDVHWSSGLIGYFPTYTLGNLYAAQLFEAAERDLGDLQAQFRRGEFQPLLEWLRTNIHQQGQRYPAKELIARVTGKPPSAEPLLSYFQRKFAPLYGV
ncbi:MAG: carboxypeptidase M32 [Armatimonadota bacterium]|nr:carboxypeptidase M32 [Armatimonadota bacterium]